MGMQLPGAWQGVPAQAGGGAPMSGQQMAAAAAVTQQGGMVASYPIQQFQVLWLLKIPSIEYLYYANGLISLQAQ